MESSLTQYLDTLWYPEFSKNWDDTLFRQKITSRLSPEFSVLDMGAGAGIVTQMNFRGLTSRVCGVDLDARVLANPFLDEAKLADGERIPYQDQQFDLVIANNVLEHLSAPEAVFNEAYRVLKPGGWFMFKTPNQFHYVPLIANFTPTSFHKWVNRRRGRAHEDSFPTFYRANCAQRILELSQAAGFSVDSIELIEGRPEYLRSFALSYFLGYCYERIVNSSELLRHLRVVMIGTLRRPSLPIAAHREPCRQ